MRRVCFLFLFTFLFSALLCFSASAEETAVNPETDYPPAPKNNEILEQAKHLKKLAECNCNAFFGHYNVFAWNEFEEGGIICPLMNEQCETDISRLKAFRKVSDYFKNSLKTL